MEKKKRFFNNWRIGLILVFVLSAIPYLPALTGLPIWDDEQIIYTGLFGTRSLIGAFTHPFLSYFRPMTALSFGLDASYSHLNPFFYHQTNILLHSIAAVLVANLVLVVYRKPIAALLGGLLFGVQPMQVGATAWIGGRCDTLAALLITLWMILIVRFFQEKKQWLFVSSIFVYLLAALAKEQVALIAVAVPIGAFAFGSRQVKDAAKLFIPYLGAIVLYAYMWLLWGPVPQGSAHGYGGMVPEALRTLAFYTAAFIVPNKSSMLSFTLENAPGPVWIVGGLAVAVSLLALIVWAWKHHRPVSWLLICAGLVYIPVSNFPTCPSLAVGPYRVAESGTVFACLLSIGAVWLYERKQYVPLSLVALNLVGSVLISLWGVHQWTSPPVFWQSVVQIDPHFMSGTQFYAKVLSQQGKYKEALAQTGYGISWIMGTDNWLDKFERDGSKALTPDVLERVNINGGRPNIPPFGNYIGTHAYYLAKVGRLPEARRVAKAGLDVAPKDAWINYLYGRLLIQKDRVTALQYWEKAMNLNPNYYDCAGSLGHERLKDRNYKEAIRLLSLSTTGDPSSGRAWMDLADARIAIHDFSGAKQAVDGAGKAMFAASKEMIEQKLLLIEKLEVRK